MGWVLTGAADAQIAVMRNGRIAWNETTHRMIRLPARVDVLHNAEAGAFALRGGGQYEVSISDDNVYSIGCQEALDEMGIGALEAIYRVTPIPFDEKEPDPAQPYIDGGVWAPLPD